MAFCSHVIMLIDPIIETFRDIIIIIIYTTWNSLNTALILILVLEQFYLHLKLLVLLLLSF